MSNPYICGRINNHLIKAVSYGSANNNKVNAREVSPYRWRAFYQSIHGLWFQTNFRYGAVEGSFAGMRDERNNQYVSSKDSQIVLYQPNETISIEVKLDVEYDTVWLTQSQMVELFSSSKANISEHISKIFQQGELTPEATVRTRQECNWQACQSCLQRGGIAEEFSLGKICLYCL